MVARESSRRLAMAANETSIQTPCTRICALHPGFGLCTGCGRSLDEIAGWIALSDGERDRIVALLPARLAAMASATIAAATA
jgi:uncharacterized protein